MQIQACAQGDSSVNDGLWQSHSGIENRLDDRETVGYLGGNNLRGTNLRRTNNVPADHPAQARLELCGT